MLPTTMARCSYKMNPTEMYYYPKSTGHPTYMQACVPVKIQIKNNVWCDILRDCWDQQLLERIGFGFPSCFAPQIYNHKSATQFSRTVDAYISEELKSYSPGAPSSFNKLSQNS